MMNEQEFITRYKSEIPIFSAWGSLVNTEILKNIGDTREINTFLKIAPQPRVKDVNSIASKAFYRKKNYKDPYTEITDKVGVRYVVLRKEEIQTICNIIESNNKWSHSKDRDFEKEKEESPETFQYQSVHYILRSKKKTKFNNGIDIPAETPCEVQIRTLLQHAYSELTHDTIYKPKTRTTPEVHRMMAKSMALIEVTDDIFEQVTMNLKSHQNDQFSFLGDLTSIYADITSPDYEEKINAFILDAFKDIVNSALLNEISEVSKNNVIRQLIKRKYSTALIYRQPVVLFIYYMILNKRNIFKQMWPLTESELSPFFSDLGIAFDSAY